MRGLSLDPRMVWGSAVALILVHRALGALIGFFVPGDGEAGGAAGAPDLLIPIVVANLGYLGALPLLGIGVGIRNLGLGYRLAPQDQRKRILWLVSGVSAAGWLLLGGVTTFVALVLFRVDPPGWVPAVLAGMVVAAPAVLVIMAAVALFYSGAVDPGLVLRRSTVTGALGVLGILLFAGLEEALSSWVANRAELPGAVGSILAGAVAAGAMLALRKGLGRLAGRFLPGQTPAGDGTPAPTGRNGREVEGS